MNMDITNIRSPQTSTASAKTLRGQIIEPSENMAHQVSTQSPTSSTQTLRENVLEAINHYFDTLKDSGPLGLHTLVIEEVEAAMYEASMKFTKGNQVQAAKILGVARGTLRTKLKQYFSTTQVGGLYHKYSVNPLAQTKHSVTE